MTLHTIQALNPPLRDDARTIVAMIVVSADKIPNEFATATTVQDLDFLKQRELQQREL